MDYKSMKYQELQTEAKNRGINTYQKKKNEIIEMLEIYDENNMGQYKQQQDKSTVEDERFEKFMAEQANFNSQIMDILNNMAADKKAPEPEIEEELVTEEAEEFENETDEKTVEPRIFQEDETGGVSQISLDPGAPKGLLLEDYLKSRGMNYKELENAVSSFAKDHQSAQAQAVTMESIEKEVASGYERAKSVVESGKEEIKTKDIMMADALHNRFGWHTVDITMNGQHYLKRELPA